MYAPAYGAPAYGAPTYVPPPPAPVYYPPQQTQQGPMIINLGNNNGNNNHGSPCPVCQHDTDHIPRKKIGGVAIAWCICLLFFGFYGPCLIPLCTDRCKDTEIVCIKCQQVKNTIQANCCWSFIQPSDLFWTTPFSSLNDFAVSVLYF
jgi:hypothetical protein